MKKNIKTVSRIKEIREKLKQKKEKQNINQEWKC